MRALGDLVGHPLFLVRDDELDGVPGEFRGDLGDLLERRRGADGERGRTVVGVSEAAAWWLV
ncbi:hypothetical protein HY68_09320 [Streptomyces sp. AcH 505]|nr:hypothetical protein HY68_09320 [Streptomyces sp. AcH 505]